MATMPGAMNPPRWSPCGPLPFLMAAGACFLAILANAADWRPEKRVEIIVPSGPGGGNDRVARLGQKGIQDRRLVDTVTTVGNKPGGGATIGYDHLHPQPRDAHFLATTPVTPTADYLT